MILRPMHLFLPLFVLLGCADLTRHEAFLRVPGWTPGTVQVVWPDGSPAIAWTVDTRSSFTDGGLNAAWGLFPTDPAYFSSTTDENGLAMVWKHDLEPIYFIATYGDFSAAGTPYQVDDPVIITATRNRVLIACVVDSFGSPISDAFVQANGGGLRPPPEDRTDTAGISRLNITAAHTELIDVPEVPFIVRVSDRSHDRIAEFSEGVYTAFVQVVIP